MGDERARLDAAKARMRAAWTAKPQGLYELGAAAREGVETKGFAEALGYADARAMWAAELPEIRTDTVMTAEAVAAECSAAEVEQYGFEKMWVVTRWVREAGWVRPPGGLEAWVVPLVDDDGQPAAGKLFAKCSVAELERALEAAKRPAQPEPGRGPPAQPEPPPPVHPEPSRGVPQGKTWPYWPVVIAVVVLGGVAWLVNHRSDEAVPEPEVPTEPLTLVVQDAGRLVLDPIQRLRPTHPTLRAPSEPLRAPEPMPGTAVVAPSKPDVGPDLTQEQLDKILLHGGPTTHPVE